MFENSRRSFHVWLVDQTTVLTTVPKDGQTWSSHFEKDSKIIQLCLTKLGNMKRKSQVKVVNSPCEQKCITFSPTYHLVINDKHKIIRKSLKCAK